MFRLSFPWTCGSALSSFCISITHLISFIERHSFNRSTANSLQPSLRAKYSFLNSYSCSAMSDSFLLRTHARWTGSGPLNGFCRNETAMYTGLARARYLFNRSMAGPSFSLTTSMGRWESLCNSQMVNPCSRRSFTIWKFLKQAARISGVMWSSCFEYFLMHGDKGGKGSDNGGP